MEMGIFAVGVLVILMLVFFALISIVKKGTAVIAAASPVFLVLIALGSVLPIVGISSHLHSDRFHCFL